MLAFLEVTETRESYMLLPRYYTHLYVLKLDVLSAGVVTYVLLNITSLYY